MTKEKMIKYLKWRDTNTTIAREIGFPYVELYRFTTGITKMPSINRLDMLEKWIKKDIRAFQKLIK